MTGVPPPPPQCRPVPPKRLAALTAAAVIAAWLPTILCAQQRPARQPTVGEWASQVRAGTPRQRVRAAIALGRSNDPQAVAPLWDAASGRDPAVARAAVLALSMHKSHQAMQRLCAAVQLHNVSLRLLALNGLGGMGRPEAIETLTTALRDTDSRVRSCAAAALGSIRTPEAAERLLAVAADADRTVRAVAIMALGQFEHKAAAQGLEALTLNADAEVRDMAMAALAENPELLRHVGVAKLLARAPADVKRRLALTTAQAPHPDPQALEAAKAFGGAAVQAAAAASEAKREHRAVMERLRQEAGDEVATIEERLGDGKPRAILSLAKSPTPGAVYVLAKLCDKPEQVTRWRFAVHALGQIRSPEALAVLRAHLAQSMPSPSAHLMNALGLARDQKCVPLLLAALGNDQALTRSLAAQTLGMIGSDESVPALVALLGDGDTSVQDSAAYALVSIASEAVFEALCTKWQRGDAASRRAVIHVLSVSCTHEALDMLRALLPTSGDLKPELGKTLRECCRVRCRQNLEEIYLTLCRYAQGHDGRLPEGLDALAPDLLAQPRVLHCPGDALASRAKGGTNFSYMYPVSLQGKIGDPDPIVCDIEPGNHGDEGRNVLFLDGTVRWVAEEDFWLLMEAIAAQE